MIPWQTIQQIDTLLFFCHVIQLELQLSQIRYYLSHIQKLLQQQQQQQEAEAPKEKAADSALTPNLKADMSSGVSVYLVFNMMDIITTTKQREKLKYFQNLLLSEFPFLKFSHATSDPAPLINSVAQQPIFEISTKTGFGLPRLNAFLDTLAKPTKTWMYSPLQKSLLSDVDIILETLREQIYRRLNQEIPYQLQPVKYPLFYSFN